MQAGSNSFFVTSGVISASKDITVSSDRRMKNSIDYDMDRYESFFRALAPCRFRYNHEENQQFHLGYIAQDVKAALDRCGLKENDFAGFTIGVKTGLSSFDDEMGLGYSEFISLNTHMIQKLLQRVEMLEATIQSMKS